MNAIIKRLEEITVKLNAAAKDAAEIIETREAIEKDPRLDWDVELTEAFEGELLELEIHISKETDEPMYNEAFNNWVDGISRDGTLPEYLPTLKELREKEEDIEMYSEEIAEALETLNDATETFALMIS